ncbi:uncharacterized protein L201_003852 [Kwoniella dendrophila CBS 6074]|uniref:Transcription factor domain-containing protein n=1 Tax=Kwoniella dendrophila CBS 6074 TaxID=1295534 RepID=A0AAX4JU83_9TREE
MGSFFLQPTDPPDFLRSFFPSDEDLRCFHHCVTYSLSIIVVFEDHNPWTEHVAPLFMADGGQSTSGYALKLALLYLGAVHLSYLQGRDGNPTESAKTRSLALRYRKECLASIRKVSSVNLVTNIAAFLSACALTLTADLLAANTRWRELMRIVNRAIRDVGGMDVIIPSSTVVDPALKCAVEALVNLSLLSTFSSGQDYSLLSDGPQIVEGGPIWWKNLGEAEMRQPGLRRFETSCGISRSLILQFTALASYLFQIPHHGRDASIENRLKEDWLLWASSQGVLEQNKRVQAGSMAIWHAGKILILSKIRKVPVSDQTIQEAASRILDICASVGDKVEYLNWPLIIACSTFTDSNKRDIARMQLKSFEIQCCYEIEVVQMVCEEMWTRMDEGEDEEACGWVEILLESGCPVLLG